MTNYDDLQKRLQRGSPQIHEANNLIAEAYGTIGALAAECERVNEELSACKEGPGTCGYWRETARAHLAEIEELKGENEALRKDAKRYRFLRNQHWPVAYLAVVVNPKVSVKLGHDCPTGERLDGQVDDAMKRDASHD